MGQFPFGERPDAFIGIEFRGVGGEMLEVETRVSPPKVVERFPVVRGGIIQQNHHGTAQMPQ